METDERSEPYAPLAWDDTGQRFHLAPEARGWLVRSRSARGAGLAIPDDDGLPLILPLSAGADALREVLEARGARPGGQYRLEQVDEHRRALRQVAYAYYTYLGPQHTPAAVPAAPTADLAVHLAAMQSQLGALVASQVETTRTVATLATALAGHPTNPAPGPAPVASAPASAPAATAPTNGDSIPPWLAPLLPYAGQIAGLLVQYLMTKSTGAPAVVGTPVGGALPS